MSKRCMKYVMMGLAFGLTCSACPFH